MDKTTDEKIPHVFPANFLWGVSTSAYQVEGNHSNNQWTAWEKLGRIRSGESSGRACDWWKNAEVDFDLAQSLGVNALRLSVEWSRVEPSEGVWDDEALKRYREMLQALQRRGIRPFVTLHHFTNPLWLEAKKGFAAPESIHLFERFVRKVVEAMEDQCCDWITFNEPNVYTALGYCLGEFPPGKKGRFLQAARVTQNLCRAHAAAYHAIHEIQANANVGWAQHFCVFKPRRKKSFLDRWICSIIDHHFNNNFADAIKDGTLPFPLHHMGVRMPEVRDTCDYVGINYYIRLRAGFDFKCPRTLFCSLTVPPHKPQGDSCIEIPYGEAYPKGLRRAVKRFSSFNKPIYILENGVPDRADRIRPWLLESSLKHVARMIQDGLDLRGYFHWSLTDNFEWNEGWHLRFGLVELNPETQTRTLRPSAHIYSQLIRASRNGAGSVG
jgi:beta-glucosidase